MIANRARVFLERHKFGAKHRQGDRQFDLAVAFARLCLPQIFFYGVYTMLSQVLNARGHFGAPTFAPLLNNLIAIATFLLFIAVAGQARISATTSRRASGVANSAGLSRSVETLPAISRE